MDNKPARVEKPKAQAKKASWIQAKEAKNSSLWVAKKLARVEKRPRKQDKEARNSTLRVAKKLARVEKSKAQAKNASQKQAKET